METIVYADVLFTVNFIINIIILKITSLLMKTSSSVTRHIAAASLGSVYAVCMFFPDISFLYIFPFKLAVSIIMLKIICPHGKLFKMLKFTAVFYMVSFTFAGILLSLIYFGHFSSGLSPKMHNGIFYFDISLSKLLTASAVCYVIIAFSTAVFKRNKMMGIKKLRIVLKNRICEMAALSDTGNLLTDPLTQNPVVIAEKNHLDTLFPDGIPDMENSDFGDIKLRLIPFSSLGNEGGMLTGFVPDEVCIDGKKTENVIIAISPDALSEKDEYNALFNPNILTYNRR